ncbi:hypothetical protein [Xanthomonas citri]|uniref:hypothetical protein n=1 Tax=Xanthomonas citri TaxID=346 RepID=UPI0001CEC673|nr:hypothetical protein [Xanthomonas citri]AMV08697.1 hypothetical protein AC028_19230 [Xanthomonas citri pv. aurantifolii]ARE57092.1 hypothetical protein TP45_12650 [Xanthomonas citri pv. aurantifolii]EFF44852.1 hypothetical protein XAUB_10650 [Xanthomonas citri pv. aurantifolii str. ICPB 11122]
MIESVRLQSGSLTALAGVDEILTRGGRGAFLALLREIIMHPRGVTAEHVRTLHARFKDRAGDPEFLACPQYQAAFWLAEVMMQFPEPTQPVRVVAVEDGFHATLPGRRELCAKDAIELADMLIAAGVQADDVVMPDWREGDSAPNNGAKIAIFHRLRQRALGEKEPYRNATIS